MNDGWYSVINNASCKRPFTYEHPFYGWVWDGYLCCEVEI